MRSQTPSSAHVVGLIETPFKTKWSSGESQRIPPRRPRKSAIDRTIPHDPKRIPRIEERHGTNSSCWNDRNLYLHIVDPCLGSPNHQTGIRCCWVIRTHKSRLIRRKIALSTNRRPQCKPSISTNRVDPPCSITMNIRTTDPSVECMAPMVPLPED